VSGKSSVTTRSRILVLAGVFSLLLIGLGAVWFIHAPARVSAESCAHIQRGMSKEEVASILGQTSDWVNMGADVHSAYYHSEGSRGRKATIEVRFDKDDRVFDKAFEEESTEAWVDRLLRY